MSFTGSIGAAVLTVTEISSGSIEVGAMITGPDIPAGRQVVAQLSGKPNGAGTYAIWYRQGHGSYTPTETLTETYGLLAIGAVNSGAVAVGQQVTDATERGSS